MLKFNLLSPASKKELELTDLYHLVIILVAWLLIFLIIFSLILATTFLYLSILSKSQNEFIEVREQDKRIKQLIEIEEKIKQTNQGLQQVYAKQKDLIIWTPILEELAKVTFPGIYLTNFSYQISEDQINLIGQADNRGGLLFFQEALEQSPYFIEIEAPLSNLIKQNNIQFSFILHLK